MRVSFMKLPECVMYLKNGPRDVVKIFHDITHAKAFLDKMTDGFKLTQLKPHIAKLADNTELVCHELEDVLECTSSHALSIQDIDTILYIRGVDSMDRRLAYATMPRDLVTPTVEPRSLREAKHSLKQPRLSDAGISTDMLAVELNINPPSLRAWLRRNWQKPEHGWHFTRTEANEIIHAYASA